jgi:hypothetical protein
MPVKLMPAIEGGQPSPCGCCGPRKSQLCLESRIAVGFGMAALTKNGDIVWREHNQEWDECMTVSQAEELASADPDHDWRIVLEGPLRGSTYQRHGQMQWVLVEKNQGFA